MMFRGAVDLVTSTEVRGWAFAADRKAPVVVQAILNREIVGEATATIHRPDLAAAGLGDGNSGYAIKLYRPIDPVYLPFLRVTVDGCDAELPRSPTLGYGEFFRSFYANYPKCGRSRSVFGGLWTDRTDAVALLEGKVAIGQVDAETASVTLDFIRNGLTSIDLNIAPNHVSWRGALTERTLEALETPLGMSLLRAVFEDHPLVTQPIWLTEGQSDFGQPSSWTISPSPAECAHILVTFGDDAVLDVVRDSHLLPEFTPDGASRWISKFSTEGVNVTEAGGTIKRYSIAYGQAALVGPGTVYRVRTGEAAVLRLTCLPARAFPLSMALDGANVESVSKGGLRFWN